MSRALDSKSEETELNENQKRASWKVGCNVLIYSRSADKWYAGNITKIIRDDDNNNNNNNKVNEWLIVSYKNNKKTKRIQRHCLDIKPIPLNHVLSLKKGSICLIYSNIIKLWCEGEIISIFHDKDGEWLRIKYYDTNEHKLCDIQRFSKDLQTFKRHLLWTSMEKTKPNKPWNILETNNLILPPKLSNIIKLNDNEYIVAAYSFDDDDDDEMNGIYKYNIIQNRWQLFILYPNGFFSQNHNISIDKNKEIIYLLSGAGGGGIWKIDIKTKKFECIGSNDNVNYGAISYVDSNNKLNIFWGSNNNKHLLWRQNTKRFDIIHQFDDIEKKGMLSFGMVYNKKSDYFLLFGGYKGKEFGRSDQIWKYQENKWEKLKIKMPDKMQSFGSVITENCQYVLIFGGSDSKGLSDKIYILNLLTSEWKLSKIKCPFKGIGYNNVHIIKSNNYEYVHLLQGMYSHIMAPIADILTN